MTNAQWQDPPFSNRNQHIKYQRNASNGFHVIFFVVKDTRITIITSSKFEPNFARLTSARVICAKIIPFTERAYQTATWREREVSLLASNLLGVGRTERAFTSNYLRHACVCESWED